ncbi:ALP1-like protein [Tanacetum coccineum]
MNSYTFMGIDLDGEEEEVTSRKKTFIKRAIAFIKNRRRAKRLLSSVLLEIPFVANGVTYPSGYYLVDGIYPELAPLVKTIPEPADDDHKRILYKQKQESARKDVERAFGVLKKKWAILANPTRALKKERIINMMYTCIILHNMIRKYKKYAISPKWFPEEMHQPDDPLRNEEQVQQVMRWIRSAQAHQNLRHDLIEHLSRNA